MFTRSLDAIMNRTTGLPANFNATYKKPLPALSVNYQLRHDLSVYAQVARGFLAPALNIFYTTALSSVLPETTTSYQVGTVLTRAWLNANADLYDVTLDNFISSEIVGDTTLFRNDVDAV